MIESPEIRKTRWFENISFGFSLQGFRLLLWQAMAGGLNMGESGFKVDPSSVNALKYHEQRLTSNAPFFYSVISKKDCNFLFSLDLLFMFKKIWNLSS